MTSSLNKLVVFAAIAVANGQYVCTVGYNTLKASQNTISCGSDCSESECCELDATKCYGTSARQAGSWCGSGKYMPASKRSLAGTTIAVCCDDVTTTTATTTVATTTLAPTTTLATTTLATTTVATTTVATTTVLTTTVLTTTILTTTVATTTVLTTTVLTTTTGLTCANYVPATTTLVTTTGATVASTSGASTKQYALAAISALLATLVA